MKVCPIIIKNVLDFRRIAIEHCFSPLITSLKDLEKGENIIRWENIPIKLQDVCTKAIETKILPILDDYLNTKQLATMPGYKIIENIVFFNEKNDIVYVSGPMRNTSNIDDLKQNFQFLKQNNIEASFAIYSIVIDSNKKEIKRFSVAVQRDIRKIISALDFITCRKHSIEVLYKIASYV